MDATVDESVVVFVLSAGCFSLLVRLSVCWLVVRLFLFMFFFLFCLFAIGLHFGVLLLCCFYLPLVSV